ncbi:hypothetical protein [Polymorphospora lycopeni]|uniref:Uncharacterized protein n=1 Tax=Polymorphospora lycopeni TaxID=3140240 RepID=A0ABV5CX77_9ACTN
MGSLSRAELDALVGDATVDAYDDDEQLTSPYTMIEDNLAAPFTTQVLGVEVTVRRVDLRHGGIVALPTRPRPAGDRDLGPSLARAAAGGVRWIEAYRHWTVG